MRWITDLHARHEGKEIWITGSDPSLDTYPDDFLDDKLSITLHLAHLKYPDATYRHANEYDRVGWFKEHRPEYMEKENIFAYPFYRKTHGHSKALFDLDHLLYYFFILRPYPPMDISLIQEMVADAQAGARIDFGGHGSCLHAAMYVAVMIGCDPINLIGCNHESRNGYEHFQAADNENWYRQESTPYAIKGEAMKAGTSLLIEACQGQGITVNWIKGHEQTLHSD